MIYEEQHETYARLATTLCPIGEPHQQRPKIYETPLHNLFLVRMNIGWRRESS